MYLKNLVVMMFDDLEIFHFAVLSLTEANFVSVGELLFDCFGYKIFIDDYLYSTISGTMVIF